MKKDTEKEIIETLGYIVKNMTVKSELKKLATKSELEKLATKSELKKLATKSELKKLATKSELKKLATKSELEKLATKSELDKIDTKLIQVQQDIKCLDTNVLEIRNTVDNAFGKLDRFIKKMDTETMERTALHHKVGRHDTWIHDIAKETGVKLA